ncbi:hypothetical protein BC834DRAFT_971389 [Gloeopeniophorella convolvens]|nr:hypothetical protein BC834DRAFT_971389 [Gloeopeniophorella convolvens]
MPAQRLESRNPACHHNALIIFALPLAVHFISPSTFVHTSPLRAFLAVANDTEDAALARASPPSCASPKDTAASSTTPRARVTLVERVAPPITAPPAASRRLPSLTDPRRREDADKADPVLTPSPARTAILVALPVPTCDDDRCTHKGVP